jgi:hypothetical protein
MFFTTSGAMKLLARPKPMLAWGTFLLIGAAFLWAQVFGLVPYPIQGA